MQGKKVYTEKLFTQFRLSERVPEDNKYRRLTELIDLNFVYDATRHLYGKTGNPSIDPKVFFKLMLTGYLENITSDRKLVEHCSLRMDIIYFLGFDIDEPLPWHSTISRTRQLYPEALFEQVFNKIFSMCVEAGLVGGDTQLVDSTISRANASMASLEEQDPSKANLRTYIEKTRQENKLTPKPRQERGSGGKQGINQRKKSSTDPDAKISTKPGKGSNLGYLCNVSVDADHHVITHIQPDYADKRDSQCLPKIAVKTQRRLRGNNLEMKQLVADTNYSSGENYDFLSQNNITSWIPVHGAYKPKRDGFIYNREKDCYICANQKLITLRRTFTDKRGNRYKEYFSKASDCKQCSFRLACLGSRQTYKTIKRTAYHLYYDQAYRRQLTRQGKAMMRLRSSRVEPVIGTLMNEHGLRKLRIRGISAVNKVMMLTAAVYNLKKLLKYQLNRKISWSISLTVPIISNGIRGKILINLKTTLLRLEKAIYHEFSLMGFDKLQKLNYH